ncbi:MAG: hypothetical protein E6I94_07230 [Chloroflexi bacterium]|nr:MAG: hypothetical protein E6I94_07230 [Chloroflexota bacterium]
MVLPCRAPRPDGPRRATFGFYTPTLRTPDLVPAQVRLLRSLIGRVGEAKVATVLLADATNGTYTTRKP